MFVDELFVAGDLRGQGIATAFLGWAREQAEARGWKRLELEVNRGNPRARALYRRLGFEDEDRDLLGLQVRAP